jgi:hypothetical protein
MGMCREWNLFYEAKVSKVQHRAKDKHGRTRKSPRRVRPVRPMTLLYVLLSQVIFHPLRLSTGVSESDAVIPKVTATPLLRMPKGDDLPDDVSELDGELERPDSTLWDRE